MTVNIAFPVWPGLDLEYEDRGEWIGGDSREPDPTWRYVDEQGHGHFWRKDDYPTLRRVVLPCTMGHGDECSSEGYWECRTCGEHIHPGTQESRPVYVRSAGLYRLVVHNMQAEHQELLTTYRFGQPQMDALLAAIKVLIAEQLEDFRESMEIRSG
jgi:hypothetical protein